MSEDRLLRELGHLAREEERAERARLDERWDRLAAGTLTAEEEAELLALAETSPEAREAYEAFRPLGPEFQARVMAKIAAELPKERRARLLPFRPAARIGGWVTAAAAAAAVLVVLLRPSAPLPEYHIASVTGGTSAMRGEQPEEPQRSFAPGDPIEVVLKPETASRPGRLKAQLVLLQGRDLRRLDTDRELDSDGAMRLTATIDPDLPPGVWTLWAVAGRPGALPDADELRSLATRGEARRPDWVALSKDIRIQPRAP